MSGRPSPLEVRLRNELVVAHNLATEHPTPENILRYHNAWLALKYHADGILKEKSA